MSEPDAPEKSGLSRRNFLKALGTTAVASAAAQATTVAQELQKHNDEKVHGPGAVAIALKINGATKKFEVEPRVTLMDLLRYRTDLTGTKEVCDRATCGACTVWLDGTPVYSCMTLAIDAQGREITTIEGLSKGGEMTAVQKAFVNCDGLQCGFCTPGFVMSVTALLKQKATPTEEDVRKACAGNLCRCGTYPRVFAAALQAAGVKTASRSEVVRVTEADVRLA